MWLIQEDVLAELQGIHSLNITPSAAQQAQFEAMSTEAPEAAASRITRKAGGQTAEMFIDGPLTERPSFLAMLLGLGGTSYRAIRGALAQADSDPDVSDIVMNINSPGGHVEGLFETIAAIQAFKKPIKVRAANANSAAYALAAAAGPIEAVSHASTFGSVGVVAGFGVDDKRIEIANTESPNKRPDLKTEDGKAVVREHLDAMQELFVGAIAEGRAYNARDKAITAEVVTKKFGRGSTLLAAQALKLKMIDQAPAPFIRPVPPVSSGKRATSDPAVEAAGGATRKTMTKEEIKAQFPAVYEAIAEEGKVAGKAEGKTEGEALERKRVLAHLKLGKTTGAMKIAEDAIAAGKSTLDEDVHADYLSASMNRRDVGARQEDAETAAGVLDGAKPVAGSEGAKDLGDEVVALLEKERGPAKKAS